MDKLKDCRWLGPTLIFVMGISFLILGFSVYLYNKYALLHGTYVYSRGVLLGNNAVLGVGMLGFVTGVYLRNLRKRVEALEELLRKAK